MTQALLLADKHICTNSSIKVLIDLFQKVAQVEGAKPSSRLARREIPPFGVSLLPSFSLCAFFGQREKRGYKFCILKNCDFYFSLQGLRR